MKEEMKPLTLDAGKLPIILLSLLAALALLLITGCSKSDSSHNGHGAGAAKAVIYHCPMHPTYTSDRPGDCPICNMKLVLIKGDNVSGHGTTNEAGKIPGRISIMLSPEKRQLIGLATSPVEKRSFSRTLRTTATVTHDETKLARIAPRFGGWVRKLHVNYTGQHVEKGAPLFTAYSPELFSTENDYLIALRNYRSLSNSPTAQQESAKRLLESGRRRLGLMEVGDEEIGALEERNQPSDELLIRAPGTGHVVTKTAVEGKSFMPGETLYEIAELGHLWLRAFVFEFELSDVRLGQKAKIVFPNLENRTYESEITFISPHIDPQTRRAEVRLELDNPGHVLKPDMWADVEIAISLGDVLAIPASSVINTGTRYVAFVDGENQHLEPREINVGAKSDDYVEVLEGVKEGERVVTRALFLVDSESQLKAAISGMGASGGHQH